MASKNRLIRSICNVPNFYTLQILEEFPKDLTKTEEDLLQELSISSRSKQHPLKKSERWLMEELNRLVVNMDGYTETLAKKARGRLLAKL